MSNRRERGISASWESADVLLFCDICIKEIELGNRPTTHFSKQGWNNIILHFQERSGKQFDRTQLKNKWDQLKKEWKLWRELKRGKTGLGWNPVKKTIDASDEWWDEKIKVIIIYHIFKFLDNEIFYNFYFYYNIFLFFRPTKMSKNFAILEYLLTWMQN
ncbi:hypothetical protein KSP39_PZI022193 [Platanthera zijinensis]|uniref:Myb/SANT-like domain-containing protein n=1 Tax=Platanthera zijinensis TaxID=2320716 RepID=A0AAP0AW83_9ASPA